MANKVPHTEEQMLEMIARELRGELSAAEKLQLEAWVSSHPDHKLLYEKAGKTWQLTAYRQEQFEVNTDAAWKKVSAAMKKVDKHKAGKVVSFWTASPLIKAAAGIALLIGFTLLLKLFFGGNSSDWTIVSTQAEKRMVVLPDSSKVWLNENSRITYATAFNEAKERAVYLDGDAFFEVKRTEGKKFCVHGKVSLTTVLGTSFRIKAFRSDTLESIEVVTGKVSFASKVASAKAPKLELLPGDRASLGKDLSVHKLSSAPAVSPSPWKTDKLEFENTPMTQVINTLYLQYGMRIELSDPGLMQCRYTGSFTGESEQQVMQILSGSLNSTFSLTEEKTYKLQGKGCN